MRLPSLEGGRVPGEVTLAPVTKRNKARSVYLNQRTLRSLHQYLAGLAAGERPAALQLPDRRHGNHPRRTRKVARPASARHRRGRQRLGRQDKDPETTTGGVPPAVSMPKPQPASWPG